MQAHLYLSFFLLMVIPAWAGLPGSHHTPIPDSAVVAALEDTTLKVAENRYLPKLARKAIAPALLIGFGITHMDDEGFFEGSRGLRSIVQHHYEGFQTSLDDYVYHVPLAMAVGLNTAGVKGEHHFTEQALLLGMTHFLNRILTNNLKSLTAIDRPDGSNNDAFPSGHTSKAFAYATFFHREYGSRSVWYSIAGYSVATATGAMRILNDRHWLSDVLTGAGIGILSAETVYLVYPAIQRVIARNYLQKQQLLVLPFYNSGAGGITLVCRIP